MKPPICVDIDNVIAQTDEVMRAVIKLFSKNQVDLRYEDVVEFDYWKCVDQHGRSFLKTEWQDIHLKFTRNYIQRIRPFDNVREHLLRLGEKFEIHIATSRLPEGHDGTRAWLATHRIPFAQLHFVGHRKKHTLAEVFVAAIEDDRDQAVLFHDHNVPAFLLAHPWNILQPGSKMTRVDQWSVLVARLLEIFP
jgi:uncharacterized HAD superfamily protein